MIGSDLSHISQAKKNDTCRQGHLGRRRFISLIAATSAGMISSPLLAGLKSSAGILANDEQPVQRWQGRALGADASLQIVGVGDKEARSILKGCRDIIASLEAEFSLFDQNSALSRLNANGYLVGPSDDFIKLLSLAREIWENTDGSFDPTVQPLWHYYTAQEKGDLSSVLNRIGFENVRFDSGKISYSKPDMAMTLNGIAQGYITDVVAQYIGEQGIKHVLVNLGEYKALGRSGSDRAWTVGIQHPLSARDVAMRVELASGQAIATSGAYGLRIDRQKGIHHLFDPVTGTSPNTYETISVRHASAAVADGLSTGFANMSPAAIDRILSGHRDVGVWAIQENGEIYSRNWA